jgi:hypothetical protein
MVIVRLGLDQDEGPITDPAYDHFLRLVGDAVRDPVVLGHRQAWQPLKVRFRGPGAAETDNDPNPFLDYRLQVALTSPSGTTYDVPGFFAGDGYGGASGDVWLVRFAADQPGRWSYRAEFREGADVAVDLAPEAGQSLPAFNVSGTFTVDPGSPHATGFRRWGRLEYAGGHYLKFRDGSYWIRGGTDSPENFLAYSGFDDTPPSHRYAEHRDHWRPGDVDWGEGRARGIVGALNYLASRHVNSVYLLTMNVGGDGQDVWPWSGSPIPGGSPDNDNLHFDISKLRQWDAVFDHAQQAGIFLHFVLNEAEAANKRELDDGELGRERKLYYRELVARFGHHLALQWNLCEEYNLQFDFGPARLRAFADYLRAVDPYDHPIAVHSAGNPAEQLRFLYGDPRFSMTSVQLNQRPIHQVTAAIRAATAAAGRPLPVSLDEFTVDRGQAQSHIPVDDATGHRQQKIWPALLSGGMIEVILEGLLQVDSFQTPERERLWDYLWYTRAFLQQHVPYWDTAPADELVQGGGTLEVGTGRGTTVLLGPQVLARPGQVYVIYLPSGLPSATLNLVGARGTFRQSWYDPRHGHFSGSPRRIAGGQPQPLGQSPSDPQADWVVLVRKEVHAR